MGGSTVSLVLLPLALALLGPNVLSEVLDLVLVPLPLPVLAIECARVSSWLLLLVVLQ